MVNYTEEGKAIDKCLSTEMIKKHDNCRTADVWELVRVFGKDLTKISKCSSSFKIKKLAKMAKKKYDAKES